MISYSNSTSKLCFELFIQIRLPSFVFEFLFECIFEASFQKYHSYSNLKRGFLIFIRNQIQSMVFEFLEFEDLFPNFYSNKKLLLRLLIWIRILKRCFEFKFEKKKFRKITLNSNSNKKHENKASNSNLNKNSETKLQRGIWSFNSALKTALRNEWP